MHIMRFAEVSLSISKSSAGKLRKTFVRPTSDIRPTSKAKPTSNIGRSDIGHSDVGRFDFIPLLL